MNMLQRDSPNHLIVSKRPEQMTVVELKAWLMRKGEPTKGKKSDLVDRYRISLNKRPL